MNETGIQYIHLMTGKLFGPVLKPDRASMRVLEKNKYLLERTLRQEVVKHNQYFDIYHYAKYNL
jgi:[ribosomal protein S5]-alanine N-acetyltransferase